MRIFTFTNKSELFKKCVFMSVANAVMAGEFYMISYEISWDESVFLTQDSCGSSGAMMFYDDKFICVSQNNEFVLNYEEVDKEILELAQKDLFPYFLDEDGPRISAIFWGDKEIFSNVSEVEFMEQSEDLWLPYLFSLENLEKHVINNYECSDEQMRLILEIYDEMMRSGEFFLKDAWLVELERLFGDGVKYCVEKFDEMKNLVKR